MKYRVKIKNPVIGVPITWLDKYSPDQYEILGLAPERLEEKDSILQNKRYKNAIQHNSDGTTQSGNKVNDGPAILTKEIPSQYPYYTSETVIGYLKVLYARVLIRWKTEAMPTIDEDGVILYG